MTVEQLIVMLTEGLDDASKATVTAAIMRDAVKAKASTLKQSDEYQALVDQQNQLRLELEGDTAQKKMGARAYQNWYNENFAKVQELDAGFKAYEAKYGKLDGTPPTNPQPGATAMTADDIQREVDKRIQGTYAPKWSDLLISTGSLVQKHMFAGRKTPIDFAAVTKIATEKYNGNLDSAYDEWDKPEREKVSVASTEAEIKRRVDEEMQKRGATQQFPAAADTGPSSLTMRTKAEVEKFDKTALTRTLANDWVKAGQEVAS